MGGVTGMRGRPFPYRGPIAIHEHRAEKNKNRCGGISSDFMKPVRGCSASPGIGTGAGGEDADEEDNGEAGEDEEGVFGHGGGSVGGGEVEVNV